MTRWGEVQWKVHQVGWQAYGVGSFYVTPVAFQDLKVVNSYLKSCFLIFPNYNLGHGLMEMAYNEYINEYYAKIGEVSPRASPLEGGIGQTCL